MLLIIKSYFTGKDLIALLLVITVTLIAWHKFYDHPIDHESFLYFYFQGLPYGENWELGRYYFWEHENNFARLLFFLLIKIFQDNIYLQVIPFFFLVILVHMMFYIMVKILTKNRIITLFAALIFSVNFVGSFEMYNHGRYFFERIPQFVIIFSSFTLFHLFFERKRNIFYFSSLILFLLAVAMGHFSTLFLPAYFFYVVITAVYLLMRERNSFWIGRLLLVLPFVAGNYLLTKDSPLGPAFFRPNQNFFEFIASLPDFKDQIILQWVGFTVPKDIMYFLSENYLRINSSSVAMKISWVVVLFYIVSFVYVFRNLSNLRSLLILSLLSTSAVTILNTYLNRVDFRDEVVGSRYFWVPHIFFSIYISILLYQVFYLRKVVGRFLAMLLVSFWILSNTVWIWRHEKDVAWDHRARAKSVEYIKGMSGKLKGIEFIGVPTHIQKGPLSFLDIYYVKGRAKMVPSEYLVENLDNFDPKSIIILGYNQYYHQFDKKTFSVVDKTSYFLQYMKKHGKVDKDSIPGLLYSSSEKNRF